VLDQTGGTVRGASVAITNIDTGVNRLLVTNDAGEFVAPNLPPGPYRVTVEANGFKKLVRESLRLEVAKDIRLELTLQPGSVAQVVSVTEELPLIDTTNDTLGGTFTNKSINDLPLNGRDFQNLVVLRPGVQRTSGGGFLSITSNGNRPEDNNFIVDGTDNNDPYYGGTVINAEGVQGTPGSILPIDAIQEFNAQENPPAEYGWKPGAIVNLGIKSGTNDLHGTAYLFERNNAFDARNFFNPKVDSSGNPSAQKGVRQHQFGGSLGGPIIKNKTFIFGAYEGIRALVGNSETLESPSTVSAGGAGDASVSLPDAIASVQAHCAGTTGAQACGVNSLSTTVAALYPANTSGTSLLNVGFPNRNRNDNFIIKGDHHFNDKNSISTRYFFGDSLQTERDIPVLRPEFQSQSKLRAQVFGINYTWLPSTAWANEARFGIARFWQTILTVDHDKDPATVYGINTGVTEPVNFGAPEIDIDGFNALGGNHGWPLLTTPNQTFQWVDNVSYTRGKHTFRFGGEFRHGSTDNTRDRYGKGRIRFAGGQLSALCNCYPLGDDSSSLEDFIAGLPRGATNGKTGGRIFVGDSHRDVTIKSFGAFFQDDWRLSPRFTLNAGLRYDLNGVIKEKNNRLANFDPVNGIQQVGNGVSAPYEGDHNNFAPRLGLSWDPWGHGKTVIRAGGGIIYEIPHLAVFLGQNGVNNASTAGINVIPSAASAGIPGGTGNIVAGATNVPGNQLNWTSAGPVFNTTIDCSASPCDILAVSRKLRTPYVATWNVNLQHQLTPTTSLQVGYVGNRGIKLYGVRDINQVDPAIDDGGEQLGRPFTANCPVAQGGLGLGGPCFPYLEFVNFLDNGYTSIYHGLQTTLTQRAWKGVNFVLGYTYSHSIDSVSLNRAQQPNNSLRPDLERANSDNDLRHRLTLALTYEFPSQTGYAHFLEGWQMNSIVTIQGGLPWNLDDGFLNGSDLSGTGEFSDRWNIVGNPGDIKPSLTGIPFVDPASFTVNASGSVTGGTTPDAAKCFSSALSQAAADQLANWGCYVQGSAILTPPAFGTFGNSSRNPFRGPRLDNWDFSIVKTTKLTERVSFQLRAEFFNVLNHPHFANPNAEFVIDPTDASFGSLFSTPDVAAANPVIGTGGPRNIQLGLKFRF
jgi:hypothetical protein